MAFSVKLPRCAAKPKCLPPAGLRDLRNFAAPASASNAKSGLFSTIIKSKTTANKQSKPAPLIQHQTRVAPRHAHGCRVSSAASRECRGPGNSRDVEDSPHPRPHGGRNHGACLLRAFRGRRDPQTRRLARLQSSPGYLAGYLARRFLELQHTHHRACARRSGGVKPQRRADWPATWFRRRIGQ